VTIAERALDRWPVVTIALLIAGACIGWALHVAWLRHRIRTVPTGDGNWALTLGRAVTGIWRTRTLAEAHADDTRRQIGGRGAA
jgi:hypothetical protein